MRLRSLLASLIPAGKFVLATAVVVAVPVAIALATPPGIQTQAPAPAPLRFEVATIKPLKDGGSRGGLQILPGGGLRMEGATLKGLIAFAYAVRDDQISGGPGWMGSAAYEILAKPERSEAADNPRTIVAPGTPAWSRIEQRLQTLLAERFRLVVHKVAKEQPGYALLTAKSGPKLKPTPEGDDNPPGTIRGPGRIDGRNGSMTMLATVLSQFVGRPVADRTGLTGTYTYKLEYQQDTVMPGRGAPDNPPDANPPDLSRPSIFTALQEQLGLRLESSRISVETIVVDRAERPSAN